MHSRSPSRSLNGHIDKLDFDENRRKKPASTHHGSDQSGPSGLLQDDDSLLSDVVDGVIERDRRELKRLIAKSLSFASALLSWWVTWDDFLMNFYITSRLLTSFWNAACVLDQLQHSHFTHPSSRLAFTTANRWSTLSPQPQNSAFTSQCRCLDIFAIATIHALFPSSQQFCLVAATSWLPSRIGALTAPDPTLGHLVS